MAVLREGTKTVAQRRNFGEAEGSLGERKKGVAEGGNRRVVRQRGS